MRLFFIIFLLFAASVPGQFYTFDYSFGEFQKASSFHLSSSGFLYITDSGNNKLCKYDTLGTLIKETGGFGWKEEAFDYPSDVFATTLNVYVCDKNNHRIQNFDKDLNFISQLSTRENETEEERFGYPLSVATSSQGDLFILDSENKRILKFDLFGRYIQNFGGMDAGSFSLNNPVHFGVSASLKIFVIDGSNIVVFDNYGNGLSIIETDLDLKGIEINQNLLSVNTNDEIYFADLSKPGFGLVEINFTGLDYKPLLVSSIMGKNKLLILTENEVLVFRSVIR